MILTRSLAWDVSTDGNSVNTKALCVHLRFGRTAMVFLAGKLAWEKTNLQKNAAVSLKSAQ